jgi:hypothetical protein
MKYAVGVSGPPADCIVRIQPSMQTIGRGWMEHHDHASAATMILSLSAKLLNTECG